MRIIERIAALVTVLAMPVVAWVLVQSAATLWADYESTPIADTAFALERGLALGAAALGAAVASYLALTGYAMILGALARRGRGVPRALSALAPAGWTKVTATALGLTLSAGMAGPALAAQPAASPTLGAGWVDAPASAISASNPVDDTPAFTVGWTSTVEASPPQQPLNESPTRVAPDPSGPPDIAGAHTAAAYVVQPGDSLWRIAESLLGAGSTDADIASAWPELYEANRTAIGEDPSLIHPGLRLTIPTGLTS